MYLLKVKLLAIFIVAHTAISERRFFVPKVLKSSEDGAYHNIRIEIGAEKHMIEIFKAHLPQWKVKVVTGKNSIQYIPVLDHYYKGIVIGYPDSIVHVKFNQSLSGYIYFKNITYQINPEILEDGTKLQTHYVVNENDIIPINLRCGNNDRHILPKNVIQKLREKRSYEENQKFYLKVSIVVPYSLYTSAIYGRMNPAIITQNVLDIFHQSSFHYSFVGITLLCMRIDIWDSETAYPAITQQTPTMLILDAVTNFRANVLGPLGESYDQTTLFVDFIKDGVAGEAYVGTVCDKYYSAAWTTIGTNYMIYGGVFSHEVGHNLGAVHDSSDCVCPGFDHCIMEAVTNLGLPYWKQGFSNCSKAVFEEDKMDPFSCLRIPPNKAFLNSGCGNGIVEDLEECDCGNQYECEQSGENNTCNYTTCKLIGMTECSSGICCNPNGTLKKDELCEVGDGYCIKSAFCNGKSPNCPNKINEPLGKSCDSKRGYCKDGKCISRLSACKDLWGPSAEDASLDCYSFNGRGDYIGNCGVDKSNGEKYTRCYGQDHYCGKLYCTIKILPANVPYSGIIVNGLCGLAESLDRRPHEYGNVPDFVECGYGYVCYKHHCVKFPEALYEERNSRIGKLEGFMFENDFNSLNTSEYKDFSESKKQNKINIASVISISIIGSAIIIGTISFVLWKKRNSLSNIE